MATRKDEGMKLRFNRQETADVLAAICSIAPIRTTKDILKCVQVEAGADVMLLSATNLELSLRCGVAQVEVETPGKTIVVADTLAKIVRECSDEILSLETQDNLLHIRGEGSHFQIVTQDEADFPAIADMDGEADLVVEHGMLQRLIEFTSFAAARESTRYAINGVLWELDGEKLSLAATDGRRLSLATGKVTTEASSKLPDIIVPGKALNLFARLPADPDTRVGVKMASNQLLLDMGRATLSTALVEGQFPKYQDVIPTDCDKVATINTAEFLGALRRASLLTSEESKGVRFAFSEGMLTLSSRAPEQGEATISIPVQYAHEPLEIGFNPVFFLEVLRVAQTEEITLAVKEANRPGVIRVGDDFIYVVMPVNLTTG